MTPSRNALADAIDPRKTEHLQYFDGWPTHESLIAASDALRATSSSFADGYAQGLEAAAKCAEEYAAALKRDEATIQADPAIAPEHNRDRMVRDMRERASSVRLAAHHIRALVPADAVVERVAPTDHARPFRVEPGEAPEPDTILDAKNRPVSPQAAVKLLNAGAVTSEGFEAEWCYATGAGISIEGQSSKAECRHFFEAGRRMARAAIAAVKGA